jgi:hypothetical protein
LALDLPVDFRVLGQVELRVDREPRRLRPRATLLLALLIRNANRAIVDHIVRNDAAEAFLRGDRSLDVSGVAGRAVAALARVVHAAMLTPSVTTGRPGALRAGLW